MEILTSITISCRKHPRKGPDISSTLSVVATIIKGYHSVEEVVPDRLLLLFVVLWISSSFPSLVLLLSVLLLLLSFFGGILCCSVITFYIFSTFLWTKMLLLLLSLLPGVLLSPSSSSSIRMDKHSLRVFEIILRGALRLVCWADFSSACEFLNKRMAGA